MDETKLLNLINAKLQECKESENLYRKERDMEYTRQSIWPLALKTMSNYALQADINSLAL